MTCMFCDNLKGGTPGNENVLGDGVVACDYCTVLVHRAALLTEGSRRLAESLIEREEDYADDYHEDPISWIQWAEEIDELRSELGIPIRPRGLWAGPTPDDWARNDDGSFRSVPMSYADQVRQELRRNDIEVPE